MKKLFFVVLILFCLGWLVSCPSQWEERAKDTASADAGKETVEDSAHYMEFETISDKDLWLRVNPSDFKSDTLKRLIDAYNASVVLNSIITDFDLQMRVYNLDEVVDAIQRIDVTIIRDSETVSKLKAYKQEMLYLLSANPDSVDQDIHNPWDSKYDLFDYLSKKYNVNTFGKLDEDRYWEEYNNCPAIPEWDSLRDKRGSKDMVEELMLKYRNSKDFDARCIYAIELAHAYQADQDSWHSTNDFSQNPAIPIMESLMKEKQYSLYLNEMWQKWRALYQDARGASRDSEIDNRLFNDYRNTCCCTILSYIEKHPDDIKAINEFLVMACKENILRAGEFPYGNQNVMEMYYLFPEEHDKGEENSTPKTEPPKQIV